MCILRIVVFDVVLGKNSVNMYYNILFDQCF